MNKARVAVTVAFISNGFGTGTFAARIPDFKKTIELSDAKFGFALLAGTLGVLLALGPAGRLSAKYGSRRVTFIATFGLALSLIGLGSIRNSLEFIAGLFAWGVFNAVMDVAMNSHAIAVEHKYEKKFMSRFHGMWSLGGFVGAFIGGIFAQNKLTPVQSMLFVGITISLFAFILRNWWLPADIDIHPFHKEKRSRKRPAIFWILGLIGFCGQVGEGAASDWGGILSRDTFHASPFWSAVPYVMFCVGMVGGRFMGDALVMKYSSRKILVTAGTIAGVGLGIGLIAGSMVGVIFGWTSLGIGLSVLIPILFSASGQIAKEKFPNQIAPSEGVGMVSGIAYAGFVAGPPIIGLLSHQVGLRWAMLLPAFLTLVFAAGANKVLD